MTKVDLFTYFFIGLVGISFWVIAFRNPEMTQQQLLINHWREYAVGVALIVFTILLNRWGNRGK